MFKQTAEQVAVIDAVKTGGNVNIQALAGSGKTSTLSIASEAISTKSCLYMAFNKAIADDAVGKMYNNTTCRTMHSVAYTGVSRELTAKLRHPRILPKDLAKNYNLAAIGIDGRTLSAGMQMSAVNNAINTWCNSSEDQVEAEHIVLSAFTSYNELLEYCKDNPKDTEITGTIALIQKFGEDKLLTIIEQASNVHRADCVITTAHKAKGLEWNKVKINNDFNLNVDKRGKLNVSEAELRLIYVAVTRAKLELDTTGLMLLNRQSRTPDLLPLLERKCNLITCDQDD